MEIEKENHKKRNILRNIRDILTVTIVFIIILFLTERFIIQPVKMKQSSMYPTIQQNEIWLVDKFNRTMQKEIKRGDMIMFESPHENYIYNVNDVRAKYEDSYIRENVVKRVIAIEGEHIQIKNEKVYIDNTELEEDYLYRRNVTEKSSSNGLPYKFLDLVVPDNYVFVMGDNREESIDSRSFGCIPISKILGKVKDRIYPFYTKYSRKELSEILKKTSNKRNFKMEILLEGMEDKKITIWSKDDITKIQSSDNHIIWYQNDDVIEQEEKQIWKKQLEDKEERNVLYFWKLICEEDLNIKETNYQFSYIKQEKYNDRNAIIFSLDWNNDWDEREEEEYSKIKFWVDKDRGEILKIELYKAKEQLTYIIKFRLELDNVTANDISLPDDISNYTKWISKENVWERE